MAIKKYVINADNNKVIEDLGNLGAVFRKLPWREATKAEITTYDLEVIEKEKQQQKEIHDRSIDVAEVLENVIDNITNEIPIAPKTIAWAQTRKTLKDL